MTPTARRIPRAGDLSVVCNEEFEPLRTELPVLSDTPAEIASTRGLHRLQPLLRAVVLATAFSAGLLFKQFNKRLTGPNDVVAAAAPGGHRPAVITGHVHMAKTAGTTLNAMMALVGLTFECGDATIASRIPSPRILRRLKTFTTRIGTRTCAGTRGIRLTSTPRMSEGGGMVPRMTRNLTGAGLGRCF